MRLQFRRSSFKPWNWSTRTWLFALIVGAVISPAVSRWIWLWQVPDVALPFDVEEFIGTEIPKEQGAFAHYATAANMLYRASTEWSSKAMDYKRVPDKDWDQRLDQWLIDNSNILSEFEVGTKMEHAGGMSVRTYGTSLQTLSGQTDPSHGELRSLLRLSLAEGVRCERAGQFNEAWRWYRAILRLADHTEESRLLIDHLTATAIRSCCFDYIREWAANSSVTAKQLHLAQKEVLQSTKNRPQLSDLMKTSYLESRNELQSAEGPYYIFPEWADLPAWPDSLYPLILRGSHFLTWSAGEPELSLRLLRQVLVNNLDQVDRPLHLQYPLARTRCPLVFELGPEKHQLPGQLSTAQLQSVAHGQLGQRLINGGLFFRSGILTWDGKDSPGLEISHRRHDMEARMLTLELAIQECYRSRGEFPVRIEDLIPDYIMKVPLDPFSPKGSSLSYRRYSPSEAILWSVGMDGVDDGGEIDGTDSSDNGDFVVVKAMVQYLQPQQSGDEAE